MTKEAEGPILVLYPEGTETETLEMETETMNSIDQLINEAETQASQVDTNTGGEVAVRQESQVARKPSLDNLMNSGMTVDDYLKVSEDGLKVVVDNKSTLFDNLDVTIDMKEVTSTEVIKYGNPAKYEKTFDGVVTTEGRKWTDAIETGARFNATPYSSADIPFTLDEPIIGKGNAEVYPVGTRLGYSLSTTNREAFAKFLRDINDQNLRHQKVKARLGYEVKKSKDYTWGIVTFELIGAAED